jgi:hypothetical protein
MLRGVVYQTLRGQPSMATSMFRRSLAAVDVARVLEIRCRRRWFMLLQRGLSYELDILYELSRPAEKLDFAPTVSTHGHFGAALTSTYEFDEWLTLRYPSEREAMLDLQAVLAKQEHLRAAARRLYEAVEAECGRPPQGQLCEGEGAR